MPKETNLNISPYFDDFYDNEADYHQVLFKPGYPIQARELTTLQTILQSQIERFGSHVFKDGSRVLGGQLSYNNNLDYVMLENDYFGVDVENYLSFLNGSIVVGRTSGVRAEILFSISKDLSYFGNSTIYVRYLSTGTDESASEKFLDGEVLQVEKNSPEGNDTDEGPIIKNGVQLFLSAGEGFCTTKNVNSTGLASSAIIESGIFFIRGYFVRVAYSKILLDPYKNVGNFKVGLRIQENIINSDEDSNLNDNANGFSNYAAPGADRFQIYAFLDKKDLNDIETNDFITISEIREGEEISSNNLPVYNELSNEFARRTFDESGNYYVKSPNVSIRETLNDFKGNNGVFSADKTTYNGNTPSESLGTFIISPMKAYVMGYEVATLGSTYLDFQKPRTTKSLENQNVNYYTGPTYTINRVYGSPKVGFSTYYVSLHLDRIGADQNSSGGKEIGLARVYDFALESGSYNTTNSNLNEWDIALYDIQTYTEITLNEPITLSVPTYIKGNSSGAVGYLRYDVSNSSNITAYNVSGKFAIGETFTFDGIANSRIGTSVTSYGSDDVKSIYGTVGTAYTFTGDIKQNTLFDVGFVNISASSGGVSTVTATDFSFTNAVKPNAIISFTNPGNNIPTYSKVVTVVSNSLVIEAVTSVSGICDGNLPSSDITPSDFKILYSSYQNSEDNTLYTKLPKSNINSVDLSNSNIIIRKQFDVTVNSGSLSVFAGENEVFLPFDEERYCLVSKNGSTEQLSADKFTYLAGSSQLTIDGLSNNGDAKLIATLRKGQITSKVKNRNKVNSIIVDKSKYSSSGIGTTTLNDGLEYGNYAYGTRVQDGDICLNESDVNKVLAIFESNGIADPEIPSVIFTSLDGDSGNTTDLILGEEFVGSNSNAIGIFAERINNLKVGYVKLSSNSLIPGEIVTFSESGIKAVVSSTDSGDKNITENFTFFSQQKDTILDYSKVTRKRTVKEPKRKLKIIFESSRFSDSDSGDLTTANSYDQFDYCEIAKINGVRSTDIIDIRPKVSQYITLEGTRSPFEFLGRGISENKNSSKYILASDESFAINYTYYLPRIDKIYLSKDGAFQLISGEPADSPQVPGQIQNAIEIAQIDLPAYLCDIRDAKITLRDYKRYRMSDIKKLEDRINNLEYYTSFSVLESDTANLQIIDSDGLNRFKSGFFVDDFSTTTTQKRVIGTKNSLDILNSELRPSHYSTQVDLLLGSSSLSGIGTSPSQTVDARYVSDLIGSNIRRTGQLITLDYQEIPEIIQPYSSEVTNVSAYSSAFYNGTIELFPSSDVWVDQIRMEAKTANVEGDYIKTLNELSEEGFDQQSGFTPAVWNSWETVWTGESTSKNSQEVTIGNQVIRQDYETVTKTGNSTRTGTRKVLKEQFDNTSFGDQVLDSRIIPYVRSRNIEFTGRRFKPFTKLYGFFDGFDMSNYVSSKLIKISMLNGIFEVGEKVIGYSKDSTNNVSSTGSSGISFLDENGISCIFRVSVPNHKLGEYNNPTEVYFTNPYNRIEQIPNIYSSTSTILNVDTYSLANKPQGTYIGNPTVGTILRGQNSGASAIIESVDLIADEIGDIIGNIWIPNPNIDVNPKFESGTKVFRLTSSETNTLIEGSFSSAAEENYYVEGKINTIQENIIVSRNARVDIENLSETKNTQQVGPNNLVNSTVIRTLPPPPRYVPPSRPSYSPPSTNNYVASTVATPQPRPQPQPQPPTLPSYSINNAGKAMGGNAADRLNATLAAAGLPQTARQGMSNDKARDLLNRAKAANPSLSNITFRP